jgi:hypothetical protein
MLKVPHASDAGIYKVGVSGPGSTYIFLETPAFSAEDSFENLYVKEFANKVISQVQIYIQMAEHFQSWNQK